MVDHLFQAAMFKEHMLVRLEFIARLSELIGDIECRRLVSAILNAGIAIGSYADPQIKQARTAHGETQIGSHH